MARRRAKTLRNGRNSGSTAFLMLDYYIFDCPAYRTMKPGPRALLNELIRRHNGTNNGRIGFGVRAAAEALCVSKDTASAYFETLGERGFIALARPGGFNMKEPQSRRATEWRLTWIKTDCTTAKRDFLAYGKKSAVLENGTLGPKNPDSADDLGAERPKNPDLSARFDCAPGPKNSDTYTSSHRRWPFTGPVNGSACNETRAAILRSFQVPQSQA